MDTKQLLKQIQQRSIGVTSPFTDTNQSGFTQSSHHDPKKKACPADGLDGFKEFILGQHEEHKRPAKVRRRSRGFRRKNSSTFNIWSGEKELQKQPSILVSDGSPPSGAVGAHPHGQQNFMFAQISMALKSKVMANISGDKRTSSISPKKHGMDLPNSILRQTQSSNPRSESSSSEEDPKTKRKKKKKRKARMEIDSFLQKLESMAEKVKVFQIAFQNKQPNFIQQNEEHFERVHRNRQKRLLERKQLNIADGTYNPNRKISIESGQRFHQNIDELDELDYELQMLNQYKILSKLSKQRKNNKQLSKKATIASLPIRKQTDSASISRSIRFKQDSNLNQSADEGEEILEEDEDRTLLSVRKDQQDKSTEALFHGLSRDASKNFLDRLSESNTHARSKDNMRPFTIVSSNPSAEESSSVQSSMRKQGSVQRQDRIDFMRKIISKDIKLREEALKDLQNKDGGMSKNESRSTLSTARLLACNNQFNSIRNRYRDKIKLELDSKEGSRQKTLSQQFQLRPYQQQSRNTNQTPRNFDPSIQEQSHDFEDLLNDSDVLKESVQQQENGLQPSNSVSASKPKQLRDSLSKASVSKFLETNKTSTMVPSHSLIQKSRKVRNLNILQKSVDIRRDIQPLRTGNEAWQDEGSDLDNFTVQYQLKTATNQSQPSILPGMPKETQRYSNLQSGTSQGGSKVLPYIQKSSFEAHRIKVRKVNIPAKTANKRSPAQMETPSSTMLDRAAQRYNSIGQFEQNAQGGGDIGSSPNTNLDESPQLLPQSKHLKSLKVGNPKNKVLKLPKLSERSQKTKLTLDDPVGMTLSVKRSKIRHLLELQENYLHQNTTSKRSQRPTKIDSPFRKHREDRLPANSSKLSQHISKKNSILEEQKVPTGAESVQQIGNDGLITTDSAPEVDIKDHIEVILNPAVTQEEHLQLLMTDRQQHQTTIGPSPSKKSISRNPALGSKTVEGILVKKPGKSPKRISKSRVVNKLNSYRKKKKQRETDKEKDLIDQSMHLERTLSSYRID